MPKTENLQTHFAELQKQRRRRRGRLAFLLFLFVASAIAAFGFWFPQSDFLGVSEVVVGGGRRLESERIVALVKMVAERDSFLARWAGFGKIVSWPDKIPQPDLESLPLLLDLVIVKDYEHGVVSIEVKEREPFGVWCGESGEGGAYPEEKRAGDQGRDAQSLRALRCVWFDAEGVVLKDAAYTEGPLIPGIRDDSMRELVRGMQLLPKALLSNLFSIFDVLKETPLDIKEMRIKELTLEEVEVTAYNGPALYFSLRFPASHLAQVIRSFWERPDFEKLNYLDFRVEHRVYYK